MKDQLLDYLRCPQDRSEFQLISPKRTQDEIESGELKCPSCGLQVPISDFIPRFVPKVNYANSFGFQRQQHARLQMDKFNGTTIQRDVILRRSQWPEDFLKGKTLLECGCGAGPDTQILLDLGATVTSVDISEGADFCRENNYPHERLNIIQGDISKLPLKFESYDVVYCHRVIQHTPDPEKTFREIVRYLKPGGTLFLHSYLRSFRHMLQWKYWLRPITKRMNHQTLHRVISGYAPILHPITGLFEKNLLTRQLNFHLIPYHNYARHFPQLSKKQLIEYGIHDTFDALSPKYDNPSSPKTIRRWLHEAGITDYNFTSIKPVVVVGRKPV